MIVRSTTVGLIALSVSLICGRPEAGSSFSHTHLAARQETSTSGERSASLPLGEAPGIWLPSKPDSLRGQVQAGEILILALPETLGEADVESYRLIISPALSWLAGRSFMWRTLPADRGRHEVVLEAAGANSASDTLFIAITVQ
ncbi:MAG: hypothetical protein WD275_00990 [Rhodothermales bacterium]